jgi:hypothetical protein
MIEGPDWAGFSEICGSRKVCRFVASEMHSCDVNLATEIKIHRTHRNEAAKRSNRSCRAEL